MELNRVLADFEGGIRAARFDLTRGDGALGGIRLAIEQGRCLQQHRAGNFAQNEQIDSLVLKRLKAADGFVELHPLLEVIDTDFQRPRHHPEQFRTHRDATLVEHRGKQRLAPLRPGHLRPHRSVGKSQMAVKPTVDALLELQGQARRILVHQIQRGASGYSRGNNKGIGAARIGHRNLASVQLAVVTHQLPRFHIQTRARLLPGQCRQPGAGHQLRQALGAQRRVVAARQGPRGQHRRSHEGCRHQTLAQLDQHQGEIGEAQADAAVFLRDHKPQPTRIGHLVPAGAIKAGLHEAVCAYALELFVTGDKGDGTVLDQHLLLRQDIDLRLQTDVFHIGSWSLDVGKTRGQPRLTRYRSIQRLKRFSSRRA